MTKRTLRITIIVLLTFTMKLALATTPKQIQTEINQAINQHAPNASIGIIIKSLTKNKTLYQKNPDRLFTPASVLKILTAVSALSFLGANHSFETKILATNSSIKKGTIDYDLYLYFDGDPSLTHEDLENLIKQLSLLRIKKITGDIYIDDSIFDNDFLGAGWMWDDLSFCYASPISAIIIDKNCLSLKLAPQKPGQNALLTKIKKHVSIINNVATKIPDQDIKNCPLKLHSSNNNSYLLTGCLEAGVEPLDLLVAIRNIRLYIKSWLLQELKNNNIKFKGSIKFGKIPKDKKSSAYVFAKHQSAPSSELVTTMLKEAEPLNLLVAIRNIHLYIKSWILQKLKNNNIKFKGSIKSGKTPKDKESSVYIFAKHQSAPLSELVTTMLKESDNTIADALYKKIGASFFNDQSTWKKSSEAMQAILEAKINLPFDNISLDDGSGLSRYNQITPNTILNVLTYAYHDKIINQSFIDALPHAGTDGTLEERMLNLKNHVYAKTGSMGSVSSLAGFVETKKKEMIVFVIMINSFLGSPKTQHELQDKICTIITNN